MEFIKPDTHIDFVGRKKWAFLVSGLLILMTFVSLAIHGGPNYGIDFAGGILVQVKIDKPTSPGKIKEALKPLGMEDSVVQSFGGGGVNEYLIRAEKSGLKLEGLGDKVGEVLQKTFGKGLEVRRVEMVGPKVGADLRNKALNAIAWSLLFIMVYISIRFEDSDRRMSSILMALVLAVAAFGAYWLCTEVIGMAASGVMLLLIPLAILAGLLACWPLRLRFALGAIVALVHDVIITVGVFSLLDREFTLATVAALLTIIGYSLNDTIVVFDRVRDNMKRAGKKDMGTIINESVNQTLSRTLLTSGTTLLVLACLYILGGGVIEDFALALLVGVVVGTYSSIFVASPVVMMMPFTKPAIGLGGGEAAPAKPANPARPARQSQEENLVPTRAPVTASKRAAAKTRQNKARKKRR